MQIAKVMENQHYSKRILSWMQVTRAKKVISCLKYIWNTIVVKNYM